MKQGWEIKKLGEVLKVQNGYAFNSKLFTTESGTPLIRIRDIKNGIGTETNFNGPYDKKYEVKAGDFLIGMDGEFGCYEWKGDTALLNQRVCRLQEFSNKLHPRFLFYGINKYLKAIEDVTAYATVKHISSKQIEAIEIPLPPLPEQKRIVSILDEAFAAIAKAKTNAEQNLKNAKELFESYLQRLFEKKGEGWEIKTIGDVCESASSNVSLNKLANNEGDYPIYGASGFIKKVSFYHQDKPYLSIVKDGSGVGRVTKMDAYTSVIGTLQYILPKENIDLDYLNYNLMSVDFKKYVAGAAIPHIYFKDYKNEPFLWMPLTEQQTIVHQLDALRAETQKLEAVYQKKIEDLDELKKSILQKAFAGEL